MIRHEHEFMEQELVLRTIALQRVEEEFRHRFGAKDGATAPRGGRDKERADLLRSERHKSQG